MPITEALAGLIGAGVAAAGSVAGGAIGGRVNVRKNKKLMKYQNDLAMHNWEVQNNYNHPALQMQRYKSAGINPFSIAGNTMSGAAASGVPSPQTLSGGDELGNSISSLVPVLQNSMTWLQELHNKRQELKNLQANEKNINANTEATNTQNAINSYILTHNLPFTTQKLESEVKNLAAQNILLSLQGENMSIRNKIDQYTVDQILPLQKLSMELSNRMAKYNADYLQPAQLAESLSRTGLNKANTALSYMNTSKAAHEIDNMILEGLNLQKRGELLREQVFGERLTNFNRVNFGSENSARPVGFKEVFGNAIHFGRRFIYGKPYKTLYESY